MGKMKTVCKINMCNGCGACKKVCPIGCIEIIDEIKNFNALKKMDKCINCHLCEKVCPRNRSVIKIKPNKWYQGWSNDVYRNRSSSGGVASAIADSFIAEGGYVASCMFNNGKFVFEITNDSGVLTKFAGSKYVKSDPQDILDKIEDKLKTNRVLFIGLPCQVAGLKNCIGNQDNLFTIDLICHGTPSVKLLDKFLQENNYNLKEIETIKFRDKHQMGISVNNTRVCSSGIDDYMLSFLSSINYTENCYYCDYASLERVSDITLGDSWGTEIRDELSNGISLILIQTSRGEQLIKQTDLTLIDVDLQKSINANDQLQHPCELTKQREMFFESIKKGDGYLRAVFPFFKTKIIKRYIKRILLFWR